MDASLKSMLDQLKIPEEHQSQLESHQIINYQSLKSKRSELENGTLSQVDDAVQKIVLVALVYLESLRYSGDPLPHFDYVNWLDFSIQHGRGNPDKYNMMEVVSEDSMEVDAEADDDDDEADAHQGRHEEHARRRAGGRPQTL